MQVGGGCLPGGGQHPFQGLPFIRFFIVQQDSFLEGHHQKSFPHGSHRLYRHLPEDRVPEYLLPGLARMVFQIRGDVLSHIQGFLPHLLVDELLLMIFQALSFPGFEISRGLVEVVQQTVRKKAKNEQNRYQRNDSRYDSQQQDLEGEPLENRVV